MDHPVASHALDEALWARVLTFDLATQLLHQPLQFFYADAYGATLTVEVLAHALTEGPDTHQMRQFTLSLRGPGAPALVQRSYRARHSVLGDFAIFITPTARLSDGMEYEACFSHAR